MNGTWYLSAHRSFLFIAFRIVRYTQNVVGRRVVKLRELYKAVDRQLSLSVLVLTVRILLYVEILGYFTLSYIPVFS